MPRHFRCAARRGQHPHRLAIELIPALASHLDVDAIDVGGVAAEMLTEVESSAAENVKRIVRLQKERSPYEVTAFMEIKTVWHPRGLAIYQRPNPTPKKNDHSQKPLPGLLAAS